MHGGQNSLISDRSKNLLWLQVRAGKAKHLSSTTTFVLQPKLLSLPPDFINRARAAEMLCGFLDCVATAKGRHETPDVPLAPMLFVVGVSLSCHCSIHQLGRRLLNSSGEGMPSPVALAAN